MTNTSWLLVALGPFVEADAAGLESYRGRGAVEADGVGLGVERVGGGMYIKSRRFKKTPQLPPTRRANIEAAPARARRDRNQIAAGIASHVRHRRLEVAHVNIP